MKALGFNMIRKHLKIESMLVLSLRQTRHDRSAGYAERRGPVSHDLSSLSPHRTALCHFTVFRQELPPSRVLQQRAKQVGRLNAAKQYISSITVPASSLWTAFNEGWGQFDAPKVTAKIKSWDSTRPVDHASGWYDQGGGDVKSLHNYFRALKIKPEARPFLFFRIRRVFLPYHGTQLVVPGFCLHKIQKIPKS